MTKTLSVEQRVAEAMEGFGSVVQMTPDPNSEAIIYHQDEVEKMLTKALTAECEAGREEERAKIPVSFLRQWINEDIKQPHQELVTNEDIMRFINIGYGK